MSQGAPSVPPDTHCIPYTLRLRVVGWGGTGCCQLVAAVCILLLGTSGERPRQKGLSLKLSSNYLGSEEGTIDSAGWKEPQRFIYGKLQSLNSAHSRNNSLYPLLSVGKDLEQHF